ncbi:hypothetical protein SGLAM104S_09080 [Streptomyces glaucescens]
MAVLPATPRSHPGLLAVQPLRRKRCAACRRGPLPLLVLEDGVPRCLDCADLGHLVLLPRGDTALTRRAREESGLSVVVVRFNRRKGRYERQGVLVEATGLARAERRCLADAEVRRRRRTRDARRRAEQDARFAEAFAAEIRRLFPAARPGGPGRSPRMPRCGAADGWAAARRAVRCPRGRWSRRSWPPCGMGTRRTTGC